MSSERQFPKRVLASWEGEDENRYLATHLSGPETIEDNVRYVATYELVKISRFKVTRELVG